jgi:hypothetical protein
MNAVEIRNQTFAKIRARLTRSRKQVYEGLLMYGPCTTRFLANSMQMDILNVRPRISDLCDDGLAELAGDDRGKEGIYRAITLREALEAAVRSASRENKPEQMALL